MLSIPEYRFHLSKYAKSAKTNQPNLIKWAKKCQFHPASRFVEYLEILSPKSKNNPIFGIYVKFAIEKVVLVYFLVEDMARKSLAKIMTQFMSLSLLRMRKQAKELAYPPPLEEKSSVKLFQEAVRHPRGTLGYAHHLERQKYHLSMIY